MDHTGLSVHAVGHPTVARSENKEAASLVLAVNSSNGPVTDLTMDNFQPKAGPVAAFGCEVELTRVVSNFPGRYLLDVVPITSNPDCEWKSGRYVIAVHVSTASMAGTGVTDLTIPAAGADGIAACANSVCDEAIDVQGGPGEVAAGFAGTSVVSCQEGARAIGGGYGSDSRDFNISRSSPGTGEGGRSAWIVTFKNNGQTAATLSTYAVCVKST
ncbi:MAG: hypothetical protein ACR2PZ_06280 [Pseudomonadales bacterium]